MQVSVSYSVRTEIFTKSNIWEDKKRLGEIIRKLCKQKKVEIIEAEACPYRIHLLVSIPPYIM